MCVNSTLLQGTVLSCGDGTQSLRPVFTVGKKGHPLRYWEAQVNLGLHRFPPYKGPGCCTGSGEVAESNGAEFGKEPGISAPFSSQLARTPIPALSETSTTETSSSIARLIAFTEHFTICSSKFNKNLVYTHVFIVHKSKTTRDSL